MSDEATENGRALELAERDRDAYAARAEHARFMAAGWRRLATTDPVDVLSARRELRDAKAWIRFLTAERDALAAQPARSVAPLEPYG